MLERLQRDFHAAVRGAAPALALGASRITPQQTWDIYRRNYMDSHIAALKDTFSTVCTIVGDDYFRQTAREYVACAESCDGDLNEYGATFPAFLSGHDVQDRLPYLSDVARLDWAWFTVLRMDLQMTDWLAALLTMPPERWPAATARAAGMRVSSHYPLYAIWQLSNGGAEPVDLNAGGQSVLVTRGQNVEVSDLTPGEDAFVSHWLSGTSLEAALEAAMSVDKHLALPALLTRLAEVGAIESIESTS